MIAAPYKTIRNLQPLATPDLLHRRDRNVAHRVTAIAPNPHLTAQWQTINNRLECRWVLEY